MATEVERKFLVEGNSWRQYAHSQAEIAQGYLTSQPDHTVRVRIMGESAYLTIKGRSQGLSRPEFEYEIPVSQAREILQLCPTSVQKTRYFLTLAPGQWTVDVFAGANYGLVLLEIEDEDESRLSALVDLPAWVGKEVSRDAAYTNAVLAKNV
ncbi:MAG: CYTH domain-containing protein [Actinomycetaceae bacterium]|nr:CYTH domain-containing protein [Actinomycetaceae bacterium]